MGLNHQPDCFFVFGSIGGIAMEYSSLFMMTFLGLFLCEFVCLIRVFMELFWTNKVTVWGSMICSGISRRHGFKSGFLGSFRYVRLIILFRKMFLVILLGVKNWMKGFSLEPSKASCHDELGLNFVFQ